MAEFIGDDKAAFDRMIPDMIEIQLRRLGVPAKLANFIIKLNYNTIFTICINGVRYPWTSYTHADGSLQGCSPATLTWPANSECYQKSLEMLRACYINTGLTLIHPLTRAKWSSIADYFADDMHLLITNMGKNLSLTKLQQAVTICGQQPTYDRKATGGLFNHTKCFTRFTTSN